MNTYNKEDKEQGFKHHFPKVKTPYEIVFNGLDIDFFKLKKDGLKEPKSFVTVISEGQFPRKGGHIILELAKRKNDYTFYIAGSRAPSNVMDIPKNMIFLGKVPQEKLNELYNKSQFYLQLSIFEGFGLSLCEAMLCECIPIGSSVNVIPEIIGDTGYILVKKEIDQLIPLIEIAVANENKSKMGQMARQRIIANYQIDRRERALLSVIGKALD